MIEQFLPHFRITGWAQGWYAGMPMLTFYFPFSFLLIAALNILLPYTLAFKLVTVLGVHSQDSDQLESQGIWQQYIERGNEQEREREVERKHGHPRIPSLRPSGDPEVGQELFYHLLRGIVVCPGVPAGGSG